MIFQKPKQPFGGNLSHPFGWCSHCSQRRIQKWSKPLVIKPDHGNILGYSYPMLVQRPQDSHGSVIIPCKNSIERDPSVVTKELIHGLVGCVAFEISTEH